MKTSYYSIIALVGIFGVGISGILYVNNYPASTMPPNIPQFVFDPEQSIEISGLEPVMNWQKPIKFAILAHKFSGCTGIDIIVFRELNYHQPILEKQFFTECNDSTRTEPREYSFPVQINSTDISKLGKYVVKASYYASRGVYGDIEKTFEIVKPSTKSKLVQKGSVELPIITEERFVVSRPDLFLQRPLRIEGLNETQHVGQKIEFTVKFNGTKSHCSFYPSLHVENSEHWTVWKSNYILELCDPDATPTHFEKEWKIGGTSLGTPIINKTGSYTLFAEFEHSIVQKDFQVNLKPQNSSREVTILSISPENVTLPENKPKPQIKQGILTQE